MSSPAIHAVTGAFGYSGQYIARQLLDAGIRVRTLTNSPNRAHSLGDSIDVFPLTWEQPERLIDALRGVDVLYNTYWVRFNHRRFSHNEAVRNTLALFDAARKAGVRRIVHTSITNPDPESELDYFRGKAELEDALRASGISYAILRPTVLFGREDILVNNIAWMLRHFPIFGVFGSGDYRLQPMHVQDFADLAVQSAIGDDLVTIDAIGPDAFTYRELVAMIGSTIGCKRPIVSIPPALGYTVSVLVGWAMRDVLVTRDEIEGLMDDLLYAHSKPTGRTRLSTWVREHADEVGIRYASELARRRDRSSAYAHL